MGLHMGDGSLFLFQSTSSLKVTWKSTLLVVEIGLLAEAQKKFWLLLQDKLSTRGVLRRRNMVLDDYTCVGCGVGVEETVDHLFLNCPFAVQCWALINLDSSINLQPLQLLEFFRSRLQVSFFMEIIILLCWSIWG